MKNIHLVEKYKPIHSLYNFDTQRALSLLKSKTSGKVGLKFKMVKEVFENFMSIWHGSTVVWQ